MMHEFQTEGSWERGRVSASGASMASSIQPGLSEM
eukprot:CAMPEP_0198691384 /NCGR_PEP_ID=MMETSP1468-20131203/202131_1 /TAXON_ID=1461545 /ORGANISM="Mantoniella sp, Strain CCMP1436" /LENGTH=34 /DNA_ID= /DNA_START= /DNA_END= /DNA_ORIENTATION=